VAGAPGPRGRLHLVAAEPGNNLGNRAPEGSACATQQIEGSNSCSPFWSGERAGSERSLASQRLGADAISRPILVVPMVDGWSTSPRLQRTRALTTGRRFFRR
jgi:hypothetical protein